MTAVLMLSVLQGCSVSAREENGAQDKKQKDQGTPQSVTIAIESDVPTLHPFDHKSVTAGYMNALTHNCLFRLNTDTLDPEPDLCSGYEALSDTCWRFELKEGVRFHDGSLVTSEDVVASMEYAASFAQASDYASFWNRMETDGEGAVIITTEKPYAMILNDLASIKIIPKALIDSGNDFNLNPIGTGPYVFEEYVLGDRLAFTAFEDYFDSEHMPSIKKLVWRIIPEGFSRTIALETGEIDVIIEPDANDITRMEQNPSITVLEKEGTRLNFLTVNTEKKPFDNLYFRKALNAAIDKRAVLEVALNGSGSASVSQLPSVFEGYSEKGCGEYDVEAAREYLQMSGYAGKTVIFSCYVYNDTARRTAEVIQACLYEIGVEMMIEQLDYAAYLSEVLREIMRPPFQAIRLQALTGIFTAFTIPIR